MDLKLDLVKLHLGFEVTKNLDHLVHFPFERALYIGFILQKLNKVFRDTNHAIIAVSLNQRSFEHFFAQNVKLLVLSSTDDSSQDITNV